MYYLRINSPMEICFVELDTDWGHQSAGPADASSAARLNAEIEALLAD